MLGEVFVLLEPVDESDDVLFRGSLVSKNALTSICFAGGEANASRHLNIEHVGLLVPGP
jgi:precorrin-4 methylase